MPQEPPKSSTPTRKRGRPPKLSAEERAKLVDITKEQPTIAIDDIIAKFRKRTGISVSRSTVTKYLREAGVVRVRGARARTPGGGETAGGGGGSDGDDDDEGEAGDEASAAAEGARSYGYNESHRDLGDAVRYPCGLTDAEWAVVRDLFEKPGPGRPPKHSRRHMLDACVYALRSGCSWRMLPKDFPPWGQVYAAFRRWTSQGLFEQMYDRLREMWRLREGRSPAPTAAVIDAQSVKTSPQGGPKGYDAGKKVKGRKRHLVTDTLGLLLAVLITTADVQDRDAADPVVELAKAKYPTIEKLYADGGYAGKAARRVGEKHGIDVEVVHHPRNRNVGAWQHPDQPSLPHMPEAKRGFVVLPKRWVVERNNAWNERPRRMNRDHDRRLDVSTAWIWLTEARMLLRRLTAAA